MKKSTGYSIDNLLNQVHTVNTSELFKMDFAYLCNSNK